MTKKNIYTIPAGVPFADALAAELLRRAGSQPENLARVRLLLPTRRACRAVQEAFLRQSAGAPLLLPKLQPLGDVDAAELFFGGEIDAAIPPAIAPLHRQILLARLVMAADGFAQGPDYALELAAALAILLDRVHTENLDLADLPALATAELAAHWDITVQFLRILSVEWPKILAAHNMIDPADRRNRLILALAAQWETQPPETPVIAAGTTGSIPATARLLEVIAKLPHGEIVLPGLDHALDEASWQALDDNHPQATLRQLLTRLDCAREDVADWPNLVIASAAKQSSQRYSGDTTGWIASSALPPRNDEGGSAGRIVLAREIMRPAATSAAWGDLRAQPETIAALRAGLENLERCDADSPQEEAQLIALYLRRALETPGRTAALVTPDRALAKRVAVACRRWGLSIDDSGGEKLAETLPGDFLRLCIAAAEAQLAPVPLLALLRHRLCRLDKQLVGRLEITLLRGPPPPPGIEGLRNRLAQHDASPELAALLEELTAAMAPLLELNGAVPALTLIDAHLQVAERLSNGEADDENLLWQNEAGEAAAEFFSSLRERAGDLPSLTLQQYSAALRPLMNGVTVRPRWGTHPRLNILGQLEARLVQADLVILGGLNEGTWPPEPGHDPWLSRPMMQQFGLPAPERQIGLAAHDFVQGFSAPQVLLTRARRVGGTPTVPARWLQRLDTVLQAAGLDPRTLYIESNNARAALHQRDRAETVTPRQRPAPTPPLHVRPRQLSVTAIDTWLRDPYSIYARYILRLRALKPLQQAPDAAARGEFLHAVLDRFLAMSRESLPSNAAQTLRDIGADIRARRTDDPGFWDFWWPRFERIADWLAVHEQTWRGIAAPWASEAVGALTLPASGGPFTLTARADRIDRLADGGAVLIDYKSAGAFRAGQIASGELPQLPLEAIILEAGGFRDLPPTPVRGLQYWSLSGANPAGQIAGIGEGDKHNLPDILATAADNLWALIDLFDDPNTPYYSVPRADRAPRYNDYAHLARVQEWSALSDAAEEAA